MKDSTQKMILARIDSVQNELNKFQNDRKINLTSNSNIDDFDLVMVQDFIEEMNFLINILVNERGL